MPPPDEPYDFNGEFMMGLKRQLISMIAWDLEPFDCVERRGFQSVIRYLDNRVQLPSRQSLTYTVRCCILYKFLIE